MLVSVIGGIPMGIGIFAVWPLAKKFGKRNVTMAGFILYAIGSLNHYSKGAVCAWLFRTMCGIRVDGENRFTVAPLPGGHFTHAEAAYTSVYGELRSGWTREKGKIV